MAGLSSLMPQSGRINNMKILFENWRKYVNEEVLNE